MQERLLNYSQNGGLGETITGESNRFFDTKLHKTPDAAYPGRQKPTR